MNNELIVYKSGPTNAVTLVFIPGYSSGLETPIIASLVSTLSKIGDFNIFGLNTFFQHDKSPTLENSADALKAALAAFRKDAAGKVILIGKSIGGAFALESAQHSDAVVVLGLPVRLGWPPRLSVLKGSGHELPNYESEWSNRLQDFSLPLLLLGGDKDDLTDNRFLSSIERKNPKIKVSVIEGANHNFDDQYTQGTIASICAMHIESFLKNNDLWTS